MMLSASGSPTLPPGFLSWVSAVRQIVTRLVLVTRWRACKESLQIQSANIRSGWYFIGINLAPYKASQKQASGFCHLSHVSVNKTPEDTEPFRYIINTILYLVIMDGFVSRPTPSPWERSSMFARKPENGLTSEFLRDFSTANRRARRQCSGVGRGQQGSALTITSSRLYGQLLSIQRSSDAILLRYYFQVIIWILQA